MVSVRSAKVKGSKMEYSTFDSLKPIMNDIILTKQLGFVSQYDLISAEHKVVFECKRHASFTWNELVKWFNKLESNAPKGFKSILVFQANRQPCLVMYRILFVEVASFEDYFKTFFVVHKGYKKKLGVKENDNLA